MPNLYETVGDVKFYNFISNRYPSGVPAALIRQFVSNGGIGRWMQDYAFSSSERFVSEGSAVDTFQNRNQYYAFLPVIGTPTENETITNCSSTATYRFFLEHYYDDRGFVSQSYTNYRVKTTDSGFSDTTLSSFTFSSTEGNNNSGTYLNNRYDWFTFCSKSPSTLILSQIKTNSPMALLHEDFRESEIYISGWMHDSIFPSPPVNEDHRYNACYTLRVYDSGDDKSFNNELSFRIPSKGVSGTNYQRMYPRYYDINCIPPDSYSAGRFLTDIILIDNNEPYQQVGKVDNRLACLGRGDFIKGKVYEVNNIFGRTGIEHWVCFCAYTPKSYSFPVWTPTTTLPASKWKYWNEINNETDYIMLRVRVEGDL